MAEGVDIRRARFRFIAVFSVVALVLLAAYSFPYAAYGIRETWFARYLSAYARIAGAVLRLGDPTVRVMNDELVGRISLTVAKNCDAMDVNILFGAAILAFPARWRRRAVGLGVGILLLVVANVIRIVSLYSVGVHWPRAFDVVHAEVWPLMMVALAVGTFIAWTRWVGRRDREPA
jgi:exosortase/archaeosortase family protein